MSKNKETKYKKTIGLGIRMSRPILAGIMDSKHDDSFRQVAFVFTVNIHFLIRNRVVDG